MRACYHETVKSRITLCALFVHYPVRITCI
jgi:hypothetical protein